MKKQRILRIILLISIIILPLWRMNTSIGAISDIDNKYLIEFPDIDLGFEDFLQQLNTYMTERLGGRNRLIRLNATINDFLFGYMEHPSYEYGIEGYVFGKLGRLSDDSEFLDVFSDFLLKLQKYCSDRNIPFVYLLNPSKTDVYQRYLPRGYNYVNQRKEIFIDQLKKKGINFIDNSTFLRELSYEHQIFNRQYDAGHWNDHGAFFGVNNLLEYMSKFDPSISINNLNDYQITEELVTSLPVSEYKIRELVPKLVENSNSFELVDPSLASEVLLSERYPGFIRTLSQANNNINLLMFQGSYFNGKGYPFVARAVERFQAIHNYENILNFDYYFNLFRPNFVVVTTAEYATSSYYFSFDKLVAKEFNPVLKEEEFKMTEEVVTPLNVEHLEHLVVAEFEDPDLQYGYFVENSKVYDLLMKNESVWQIVAFKENFSLNSGQLFVVTKDGEKLIYKLGASRD